MTNIPAGWYPDPSGTSQQRWWDGTQWSEHFAPGAPAAPEQTAAEPDATPVESTPAAEEPAVETPAAEEHSPVLEETVLRVPEQSTTPAPAPAEPQAYQPFGAQAPAYGSQPPAYGEYAASGIPAAQPYAAGQQYAVPTAPPGTDPYTPWIWIIAGLPVISILLTVVSIVTTDVDDLVTADPSNPFAYTPADIISGLLSWVIIGLTVLFSWLDFRDLRNRGVEKPFHWAFAFFAVLSAPVYMIGRSIVVRRRVGKGLVPLFINLGLYLIWIIVGIAYAAILFAQIFSSQTTGLY